MTFEDDEVEQPQSMMSTQYAYLCITGAGSSQKITDVLGLKPTKEWSEGDPWIRSGQNTKRFFMHWDLESGLEHSADLNDHIRAIMMKLRSKRSAVLELVGPYDVKITCVSYDRTNFSFELDFGLQRQLTDFGIRLWFDTYLASDPHALVQDLRQQIAGQK
ncbi:MAG: DUF4279 domain-containing protein [Hyphomonadaceae bacterium]